jgi:hypothetical protein
MRAALRRRYGHGYRSGVRSGIARKDVWHLSLAGKPVCGARRYRASMNLERGLEVAVKQIQSQGGHPCERCLKVLS